MGREHDPVPGQWYENLEEGELFRVLSVDEDSELVEIQYSDGDVEEIDYDTWTEMDLELSEAPEGWSDDEDEEDLDEDEEEDDWEDDEEDDDDEDWDDEDDDGYGDRDDY